MEIIRQSPRRCSNLTVHVSWTPSLEILWAAKYKFIVNFKYIRLVKNYNKDSNLFRYISILTTISQSSGKVRCLRFLNINNGAFKLVHSLFTVTFIDSHNTIIKSSINPCHTIFIFLKNYNQISLLLYSTSNKNEFIYATLHLFFIRELIFILDILLNVRFAFAFIQSSICNEISAMILRHSIVYA